MAAAEKISVMMTADMMRDIRERVAAGEFASTSEALQDAVRVWQQQRREQAECMTAIRARIRRSLDDPRPDLNGEAVDAHLEALFTAAVKDGNAPA